MNLRFICITLFILSCSVQILGQTTIKAGSELSGVLLKKNSPYYIEGKAVVPKGETLVIEPGVELRFGVKHNNADFNYASVQVGMLHVRGKLIANGTSENGISFLRKERYGKWGVILFDGEGANGSEMTKCAIQNASSITNFKGIRVLSGAISVVNAQVEISNCQIINNTSDGIFGANSNLAITSCFFRKNGAAIILDSGQVAIKKCIIDQNATAITCNNSSPQITYCTITRNTTAAIKLTKNSAPSIRNVVFWTNKTFVNSGSEVDVKYSVVNNYNGGKKVESDKNLWNVDPEFADPSKSIFLLKSTSPCIGAGENGTDIGSFQFKKRVDTEVVTKKTAQVTPKKTTKDVPKKTAKVTPNKTTKVTPKKTAKVVKETKNQPNKDTATVDFMNQSIDNYSIMLEKAIKENDVSTVAKISDTMAFVYETQGNIEEAIKCYKKGLEAKKQLNDKAGMAVSYHNIGNGYYQTGKYTQAVDGFKNALAIAESTGNKKDAAVLLNNIGVIYDSQLNYDAALGFYDKSLKYSKAAGDDNGVAKMFYQIGNLHYRNGDMTKTLSSYKELLQIEEQLGDENGVATSLTNIGVIYYESSDYDNALTYYEDAKAKNEKIGNKHGLALTYNNIGNINYYKNEYAKALKNYEKSLEIKQSIAPTNELKQSEIQKSIAISYHNLANVYRQMKNVQKAVEMYEQSNKLADGLGLVNLQNSNYLFIAELQSETAQCSSVIDNYKKALGSQIEEQLKNNKQIAESHRKFVVSSEAKSNLLKKMAQVSRQNFNKVRELTQAKDQLTKNMLVVKLSAEQKSKELALLNKELELSNAHRAINEAELKRKNIIITSAISGVGLLTIMLFFILKQYRQKKRAFVRVAHQNQEIMQKSEEIRAQRDEIGRQHDVLVNQNEEILHKTEEITAQRDEIEEQNKFLVIHKQEITDSINYASRIQTAMLPRSEDIKQIFNDYFVLFKPKDIVSGDFYFFEKVNNYIFWATADCTGHGVPGGFMSMLGIAFLQEIIHKQEIVEANCILQELRTKIKTALRQTGEEGASKDGMDIALCIIDIENKKAQFSGAYNPLFIIRNDEIIQFKADRQPIAIYPRETDFSVHNVDLQENDVLYSFSDGYVDQFGGEFGKKYRISNFKKLLIENYKKPMQVQHEILNNTIESWRENEEQVDDMLVFGLRFQK